jgi:hypothetical protein
VSVAVVLQAIGLKLSLTYVINIGIIVTLLCNLDGGPHRVLIEFAFEFTKEYLRVKDVYVFLLLMLKVRRSLNCSDVAICAT